jgi:hypothetical protein
VHTTAVARSFLAVDAERYVKCLPYRVVRRAHIGAASSDRVSTINDRMLAASRHGRFGALLILAFILILGAVALGLTMFNPRGASSAPVDDRKSADALASAKAALIGYAVARGGPTGLARPGELPCPDMNGDGLEETNCNAGAIGRLPWRTLGIQEPTDRVSETLWYAVAGPVRTQPSNPTDINSNTRGNLVVRAADGVTVLTSEAAAVIFAPGPVLGNQRRKRTQSAPCGATETTIAAPFCADNYLDTTNGVNNARANGPFIAAVPNNTYNDRVIYVTVDEYLPAVEMRVGNELRNLLLAYRQKSLCQCFPWADSWTYSGAIADVGVNRGRFPSRAYPEAWGQGTIPLLPQWVVANGWHNVVFYSAGRESTDVAGAQCFYCSARLSLTVDGAPVKALLFTPGPPPPGIDRASAANRDNLTYYLDDPQNNDKAACPGSAVEHANTPPVPPPVVVVPASCDTYMRPTSTVPTRDRIFTISNTQCVTAANALVREVTAAPCGPGGAAIRRACQTQVDALLTCTCRAAAQSMTMEPCRTTLNPGQCQVALNHLLTCGL